MTYPRKSAAILVPVFVLAIVSACARAPENVAPRPVSGMQYDSLTCAQISAEAVQVRAQVENLTGIQRNHRNSDTLIVTGSILFFPIAAIAAPLTPDVADDLALVKGQSIALQSAWNAKGCGQ